MRKLLVVTGLVVAVGLAMSLASAKAEDSEEKKAKYTIKEVMKQAHKDGLLKKVSEGSGTDADKSKLLDLYLSLLENKPKKGEEDSWHKLAGGAVVAAAKVAVGRDGAIAELKTATNCKACHSKHK